ncbi:MAG: hypothetical protein DLM57_16100 [Pseudonocardiales bacterium]|nr:MAG: hypothetical protein DLM57_16100 [Pseudonocardiales bacterium]
MTLVEFLQARLAEDELIALAATDGSQQWRTHYDYRDVKDEDGHYVVQADTRRPSLEQAAHIARHCPARVLREVEAKRAVIADYLRHDAAGDLLERDAVEDLLEELCSVYADHPDYIKSWS